MSTPVHVIAGFLGAGKTTALLHLLAHRPPSERVAVVVNDFGEAAIDEALIEQEGVRVAEIHGACVCCTAPQDFTRAMGLLLDEVRPDRILIEPTGLARPADLVDTLRRGPHRHRLAVGPLVVLVDSTALDETEPGSLRREQAEAADVLVASRTDLASEDDLARFDRFASTLWPGPLHTLRIARGELPEAVLDWPEGTGPRTPAGVAAALPSTAGFRACGLRWPPDTVFSRDRLLQAVHDLAGDLQRLKGMFRTEEGVRLVEVAGGRVHERPTGYRRDSRVDLVVRAPDDAPLQAAAEALRAAELTEEEQRLQADRLEVMGPDGTSTGFDRQALAALPDPIPDVSTLVPGRSGEAARLQQVLAAAGIPPQGEVVAIAFDGFTTPPVPLQALTEAVVLHSMGGEALPEGKGGPFRLLIPGDAGPGGPCANVKGLVRLVIR